MKHRVSIKTDQVRPAEGVALSFILPEMPQKAAWNGLLCNFPYLAANRQAGQPVPGSQTATAPEASMNWSGPRGLAWSAPSSTLPRHTSSDEKSASINRASVFAEAQTLKPGTQSQPMVPALGLMLNTPGGRASTSNRASTQVPGLRSLLDGAFRPLAGTQQLKAEDFTSNAQTASADMQARHQAQVRNTEPPAGEPQHEKPVVGKYDTVAQNSLAQTGKDSTDGNIKDNKGVRDSEDSLKQDPRDATPEHRSAPSTMQQSTSKPPPLSIPTQGSIVQRMARILSPHQTTASDDAKTTGPDENLNNEGLRPVAPTAARTHSQGREFQGAPPPLPDQGSVVERMSALLASNRIKIEQENLASPAVSSPQRRAAVDKQQTSSKARTAQPVAQSRPLQALTPFPAQTSMMRGMAKILSESKSTRTSSAGDQAAAKGSPNPVSQVANPNNKVIVRASSATRKTLDTAMPSLSMGGLNTLRALMPAAVWATKKIKPGMGEADARLEHGASLYDSLAQVAQVSLQELSSETTLGAPLVQRRARKQGGGEIQVLTQLIERMEGRLQENVRRLVEQRIEQTLDNAKQVQSQAKSQDQNPRESLDHAMLISDEVVQALMNKMSELSEEARFRSGRLR